jgi:hypothetical protein
VQIKRTIHYFLSFLASFVAFVMSYGLIQFFVTRNILGDAEIAKLALNFFVAGIVSGAVYAATFRQGRLMPAIIPAALLGGLFLSAAIYNYPNYAIGEVRIHPWQSCIPGLVGIISSYFCAKFARWILSRYLLQLGGKHV